MFQTKLNRAFAHPRQLIDFISFTGKNRFQKLKMNRRKLWNQNRMRFFHFLGKHRHPRLHTAHGLLPLLLHILKRRQQRADTDFGRPQIIAFVNFNLGI